MKPKKSLDNRNASVEDLDAETALYSRIHDLVLNARRSVARGVDLVQVRVNFEIGRHIFLHEQQGNDRADYGKELLTMLSSRLMIAFGNGYSRSNLEYFRRFYIQYQDRIPISQTVSGKLEKAEKSQTAFGILPIFQTVVNVSKPFSLSWSHYVFLLGVKNSDERNFYEIESTNQDWTLRELKRQFSSGLYERLGLSRDKEGIRLLAQEGQVIAQPQDLLKEPLILEFLGLSEQARYSESDLESTIISQLEHFLLELGKGFLFEARQKRFTFDGDHFFVDLVFYNRLLRCYVLIDLKIGKLTHQDLGQMQMYVNTFDREIKTPEEAPTIGMILCKQKHQALVEITLPKDANIHASEYQLCLPSKEELQAKLMTWAEEAGG